MFQEELLNRVAQNMPLTLMAKALLENVLSPQKLDNIFRKNVRTQREREILFSFVVYRKYTKHPPGKKAPPGVRKPTTRHNHASTARLLEQIHDKSD